MIQCRNWSIWRSWLQCWRPRTNLPFLWIQQLPALLNSCNMTVTNWTFNWTIILLQIIVCWFVKYPPNNICLFSLYSFSSTICLCPHNIEVFSSFYFTPNKAFHLNQWCPTFSLIGQFSFLGKSLKNKAGMFKVQNGSSGQGLAVKCHWRQSYQLKVILGRKQYFLVKMLWRFLNFQSIGILLTNTAGIP